MPNENFVPTYSTDIIYRGQDPDRCLTDDLDAVELSVSDLYNVTATKANMSHTHSAYAPIAHEHEEYAPLLHDHYDYSMSDHTHSEYATTSHTHNNYAPMTHTHTDYARVEHTHTGFATSDHTHTGFATESYVDTAVANVDVTVDTALSATSTNPIRNNAVNTAISGLNTAIAGKADSSHGTHVSFTTTVPKAAGTAAVGSATTVSRSDHVHPAQTTVSGNAGSATKLATARTIRTNLGSTSTASFNGTANVTPGVTGTLPIANGGTGATTVGDALSKFGIEDHVVSQGKSGNTYYRKWNSGILEQWYQVSTTSQAIDSAYGSLYIGTHRWTFPVAFTDVDVVLCSYFRWGTSASWGGLVGATTTYADLRGYDLYSRATGTTCTITAYAKGRWK